MLDEYLDKRVRVLVSTGTGAGISNGELPCGTVFNPIITVFGVLNSYDNLFLKLEKSRMIYYNGVAETLGVIKKDIGVTGPDIMENDSTILNLKNVISVSLVREK